MGDYDRVRKEINKGWGGWAKVFEERHYPSQGVLRELIKYFFFLT